MWGLRFESVPADAKTYRFPGYNLYVIGFNERVTMCFCVRFGAACRV